MRNESKNYSVDLNDSAAKNMSDKQELRKKVANIIVDRKKFDEALKLQTGKNAIKKVRENIEHGLSGNREVNHFEITNAPTVKGHVDFKSKTSTTSQPNLKAKLTQLNNKFQK